MAGGKNCIPWEGTEGNEGNTKGVSVFGVGVDILKGDSYCKVGQLFWCVSLLVSRVSSVIIRGFEEHINENITVEKLSATCGIF